MCLGKVFCIKCRWFYRPNIIGGLGCIHPNVRGKPTIKIIKDYLYGHKELLNSKKTSDEDYPNKEGKCKYYKVRKERWKIWIR